MKFVYFPPMAASRQVKSLKTVRRVLFGLAAGVCLLAAPPGARAQAPAKQPPTAPQATPQVAPQAAPQAVPGFWDPRRRPERPDLSRLTVIRFLTETDYPPFNYTGADGNPAGFNVDFARALCEEIKVTCTVQMRRFETLVDALASNRGDAIIASMAVSSAPASTSPTPITACRRALPRARTR
jgi:polar amino acid transport system substrate-binding protein